jgi:hypothetical protein
VRFQDLSVEQRALAEVMREHQFGRVENMPVRDGQPILGGTVRLIRTALLTGDTKGVKAPRTSDFGLKCAVVNLFGELARLNNGTVLRLEFRHPSRLDCTTNFECPYHFAN